MAITVGIAGITGKFARLVVKHLCNSPNVQIRGLCRNSSKLPERFRESPRVTIIQGDSTDLDTLRRFARGCDVVICCYLYNKMQATFQNDPSNIFAYIAMFYQYYCTNGQTYLKKDLDNSKYPEVTPVTFKGFLQGHKMEDLTDAYQNAGSAV